MRPREANVFENTGQKALDGLVRNCTFGHVQRKDLMQSTGLSRERFIYDLKRKGIETPRKSRLVL